MTDKIPVYVFNNGGENYIDYCVKGEYCKYLDFPSAIKAIVNKENVLLIVVGLFVCSLITYKTVMFINKKLGNNNG